VIPDAEDHPRRDRVADTALHLIAAIRVVAGVAIGWRVVLVVIAPETSLVADAAAVLVGALTAWRAELGLAALAALAPAGLLLTPAPARVAELLAWTFVAAWLVSAQRERTARIVPHGVLVPAVLLGACGFASWVGQTIQDAGGVEAAALPVFVLRALVPGYLMSSASEPHTVAWLQMAAGLSVLLAAAASGREARTRRVVVYVFIASAALIAIATIADVGRQWAANGYGEWFLLRYLRGERFALHVPDLNAAGSIYVLAILLSAAMAIHERRTRRLCAAAVVLLLPALWLTGSRSAALGALIAGAALIAVVRRGRIAGLTRGVGAAVFVAAVALGGGRLAAAGQPAEHGSAAESLWIRSQFLVTSTRMLASAPVYGVGIGRYHERSGEFMPPALRAIYPHENAHNYFAQMFAELGVIGGTLFVWLIVAVFATAWRALRAPNAEPALLALVAGTAGYVITCLTGHPLLVPEAALPFWALFGVAAASSPQPTDEPFAANWPRRIVGASALVLAIAAAGVALDARAYRHPSAPTAERGFYPLQRDAKGQSFVWMTRHGVWSIGPQAGRLVVPLRAPHIPSRSRAFVVSIDVAGWRAGRYTIAADRWTTITIPLRDRSERPFRRVDVWANQTWTRKRELGDRDDDAPRSVMVGEVRWEGAGGR
jgi:O-antigen ligase